MTDTIGREGGFSGGGVTRGGDESYSILTGGGVTAKWGVKSAGVDDAGLGRFCGESGTFLDFDPLVDKSSASVAINSLTRPRGGGRPLRSVGASGMGNLGDNLGDSL